MKKLHDEQERTVRELKEQTERIGNDAASLTQALKGDSKMQGDWGEMILDKTLEDCGLQKDEQYTLQETFKDEDGNVFRPDAVVNFPNGERVIQHIQKVSKPGRRFFSGPKDLRPVLNGFGITILSTNKGVLSDREARESNVGGEVIREVW